MNHSSLFHSSVTRLAPLQSDPPTSRSVDRQQWQMGDLVVAEMISEASPLSKLELPSGRMIDLMKGDRILGALGRREATLECVGDFEKVQEDGLLDLMTPGGLLGRITSQSSFLGSLPRLRYQGHVQIQGSQLRLSDFVNQVPLHPLRLPVVLVIGTSMSAGKTASARVVVRLLRQMGHRVGALKLTGAARYRDILSLQDAGAQSIADFVEAGLPSSCCPGEVYRRSIQPLLSRFATQNLDSLVVEAGASPLEPYNGDTAIELLQDQIRCTILAASDPYAVLGVMRAFERTPDLVTGVATNTSAGIRLIEKLTGCLALNLQLESSWPTLEQLLKSRLETP